MSIVPLTIFIVRKKRENLVSLEKNFNFISFFWFHHQKNHNNDNLMEKIFILNKEKHTHNRHTDRQRQILFINSCWLLHHHIFLNTALIVGLVGHLDTMMMMKKNRQQLTTCQYLELLFVIIKKKHSSINQSND